MPALIHSYNSPFHKPAKPPAMLPLTPTQLLDARQKIIDNAQNLVVESKLLLETKHFARAYSLAVLACEEVAKLPMLVSAETSIALDVPVDWERLGKRMRIHRHKLDLIDVFDKLLAPTEPTDEELLNLREDVGRVSKDLDEGKQDGFYVDVSAGTVRAPTDTFAEERATKFVSSAAAVVLMMASNPAATTPATALLFDEEVRARLKHLYLARANRRTKL